MGVCRLNVNIIVNVIVPHGKYFFVCYNLCVPPRLVDCGCDCFWVSLYYDLLQVIFDCIGNKSHVLGLNSHYHQQCVNVADITSFVQIFVHRMDTSWVYNWKGYFVQSCAVDLFHSLKINDFLIFFKLELVDGVWEIDTVTNGVPTEIIFDSQGIPTLLRVASICVWSIPHAAVDTDETIRDVCIWCRNVNILFLIDKKILWNSVRIETGIMLR
jgi:hypothetical protein